MKNNSIDKKKIESLLPHREPMLLIDRLINIVHLRSATAVADFRWTMFISLSINNIGSLCGNKLSIFFLSIELFFIFF